MADHKPPLNALATLVHIEYLDPLRETLNPEVSILISDLLTNNTIKSINSPSTTPNTLPNPTQLATTSHLAPR